jgi:hypothetical protein
MKIHQEPAGRAPDTPRNCQRANGGRVTELQPLSHDAERDSTETRGRLVESLLDNLSAWTVIALVIGVLYLVWATIEILSRYVHGIPAVGA